MIADSVRVEDASPSSLAPIRKTRKIACPKTIGFPTTIVTGVDGE
jgi:hypothetical protein